MKRPHLRLPHVDVHSLGFQTSLEITAGAVAIAALLRWLM